MAMPEAARVLVVSPNWLGDAVMALPAIADIRRDRGTAHLVVASRRSVADLFTLVPGVDAVVPLDWRGRALDVAGRRADEGALTAAAPDVVVLFPNSFASAWLTRRAGVAERWGYAGDFRTRLLTRAVPRPRASVHQVEYYQALVHALGIATGDAEPRIVVPDVAMDDATATLVSKGWDGARPLVVLAPGAAYGTAKRWLPSHFAELVTTLVRGHDAVCALVGSRTDGETTLEICSRLRPDVAHHVIDLTGATTLVGLAATLARARVCVTNDSGAMHVAAAVGTPVAALFGPTREHETAPATTLRRRIDVLTSPVWCRPCMLRECPIDHRCMAQLRPSDVLPAILRALTGGSSAMPLAPVLGEPASGGGCS